jgi:hypothetical protein
MQHPVGARAVQIELIVHAGVRRGQGHRAAIDGERHMRQQRFIDDRKHALALVAAPLRVPLQASVRARQLHCRSDRDWLFHAASLQWRWSVRQYRI